MRLVPVIAVKPPRQFGGALDRSIISAGVWPGRPAKTYVPDIGKLEVLEGFDANGNPKLRAPRRDITTRMLMLHTAGLGYDFFNATYLRLAQERGQPSVVTCSKASLMTPLLFEVAGFVLSMRFSGLR